MPEDAFIRVFRLSPPRDPVGVQCDAEGAFVGPVPLLDRATDDFGRTRWDPRSIDSINRELSFCYGLPVDMATRAGGLTAVANALNDGALLRAQIATLHLRLPDLLRIDDGTHRLERRATLARTLHAGGLLKEDWDPEKHPRLGVPPNAGWFAPTGQNGDPNSAIAAIPVADFSGGFHDVVVDLWMKAFDDNGIPAVKAPAIRIIGPYEGVIGYPDIIIHRSEQPIEVIEVKTGINPAITPNQAAYIPMLQYGGHIYSTDTRIRQLGLEPGIPFPPVVVYILFANPGQPYDAIKLPPPTIIPTPNIGP